MHSYKDTYCGHSFTESELTCFLICTALVTETVACLVSACELGLLLMCTVLVTETVASLVSGCELA